ncbi:MAG: tripartite tricarboxylate transporter substrate-binding protein [Spirochaetales bacterium]|nr:tripartite tricarboxylate transporter substrate-binding protein [Spirochaetales bacterium]
MRKVVMSMIVMLLLSSGLFANGQSEGPSAENWPEGPVTIICPWAVGGVADMVNRKAATFGPEYLGVPVLATNELGAGGNVAMTNYLKNQANSTNLIFGGEGSFSIAPNIDGSDALRFTYDDFEPVINLYSSIFVMTADASLGITDLESLKEFGTKNRVKVAVNGVASSEAFLAMALFDELGINLELVSYNGANLALDAAAKGETSFAISHQSQARGSVEAGVLSPVVMFDEAGVENDVFKGVKGVGEYGYSAYYRNRCFILARKGTDPAVISKIRDAYLQNLEEPEVVEFFNSLMIEVDPLTAELMNRHIADVAGIVKSNQ